jgi:folate-binding Fe-S cluster repair protein YgfZ
MEAVSFTKGCYVGQEIVERIRAQGHVNKELVRIALEGTDAPAAGAKLTAGGTEAGEIASAVYSPRLGRIAGLAWVRRPHNAPGTSLAAGSTAVTVV